MYVFTDCGHRCLSDMLAGNPEYTHSEAVSEMLIGSRLSSFEELPHEYELSDVGAKMAQRCDST